MTETFTPLNDRILVRKDAADTRTPGGVLLPDVAQSTPTNGTVLAVGPGLLNQRTGEREPLSVVPGDRIAFSKYASNTTVRVGNEDLLIIREADVFGVRKVTT